MSKFLLLTFCFALLVSHSLADDECTSLNCSTDEFEKPIFDGKRYQNPKSFYNNRTKTPSAWNVMQWLIFDEDQSKLPSQEVLEKTLPVQVPKFDLESGLSATWLGHSTVFVRMDGLSFITDPIWANRASPFSFAGPKRYRPTPCEIDELPELDFVLLSHNHYDHLDEEAVKALSKRFPAMQWFVPVGLKEWMISRVGNASLIYEMSWGEHLHLQIGQRRFTVWCLPAQHNSRRWIFDGNKSLWVGWAVLGDEERRFYYSGDTGFCENEFRKIGRKLGPFDFSLIPIGAYKPRYIMQNQHVNPEEAVKIHQLVRSKKSLAVHWGTYKMGSNEGYLEPKEQLENELLKANVSPNDFFTLRHGETWTEEKAGREEYDEYNNNDV